MTHDALRDFRYLERMRHWYGGKAPAAENLYQLAQSHFWGSVSPYVWNEYRALPPVGTDADAGRDGTECRHLWNALARFCLRAWPTVEDAPIEIVEAWRAVGRDLVDGYILGTAPYMENTSVQ